MKSIGGKALLHIILEKTTVPAFLCPQLRNADHAICQILLVDFPLEASKMDVTVSK